MRRNLSQQPYCQLPYVQRLGTYVDTSSSTYLLFLYLISSFSHILCLVLCLSVCPCVMHYHHLHSFCSIFIPLSPPHILIYYPCFTPSHLPINQCDKTLSIVTFCPLREARKEARRLTASGLSAGAAPEGSADCFENVCVCMCVCV